jgi:tetratricopeptide (TPR) repeat protein
MGHREEVRRNRLQEEAFGYLELEMYEAALRTLDRLDPESLEHPASLHLRGEALRSLGRCVEALDPLLKAAEASTHDVGIRLAIGWCQKRCDRLDLAIDSLQAALKSEPQNSLVLYNLSCYFSLADNKTEALKHLIAALEISPHFTEMIDGEPDFDAIRNDPEFKKIRAMF